MASVSDTINLPSAARGYWERTLRHTAMGDYAEEDATLVSVAISLGAGFLGVDAPMDLRDLSHNVTHWEWSWSHLGKTALNALGVLPVIGMVKNLKHAKRLDQVGDLAKNTDRVGDLAQEARSAARLATNALETVAARLRRLGYDAATSEKILDAIRNGKDVVIIGEDMKRVRAMVRMVENAGGKVRIFAPKDLDAIKNLKEANRRWFRRWAKEEGCPVIALGRRPVPRKLGPSEYYDMESRMMRRWRVPRPAGGS
jgi:hypothetical protein